MSQVPKIYHIPIREPMFINGVMSPVWVMFFENLTKTANITAEADLITLAQKQDQIEFGALVGMVALQNLLGDSDVLSIVQVGQEMAFCGLPLVAINNVEF